MALILGGIDQTPHAGADAVKAVYIGEQRVWPPPLVADSFDRADAAVLGSTDTGQPWTVHAGSFGILTNEARSTTANIHNFATVDAGRADARASFVVRSTVGFNVGLLARFTDTNNHIWLLVTGADVRLRRVQAGAITTHATYTVANVVGDTFALECDGDNLTAYRNGVALGAAVVDAFNNTVTRWGLRGFGTDQKWDDFLAERVGL